MTEQTGRASHWSGGTAPALRRIATVFVRAPYPSDMVEVAVKPTPGNRLLFYGVILVGVALIALSFVVTHPAAQAAPDLYAGTVLLVLAAVLGRQYGRSEPVMLAAAGAMVVGAAGVSYTGLATLSLVPTIAGAALVGDLGIIVGMGLFLYERMVREPARP